MLNCRGHIFTHRSFEKKHEIKTKLQKIIKLLNISEKTNEKYTNG